MEKANQIAPGYIRTLFVIGFSAMICFHQTASAHGLQSKYQSSIDVSSDQDTDDNKANDADEIQIQNRSTLIAGNVNLQMVHVFYEIMSIEYDEVCGELYDIEPQKVPDSYTRVLFRRLISPNAP